MKCLSSLIRPYFSLLIVWVTGLAFAQNPMIPHITRDSGGFQTTIFLENPSSSVRSYSLQGFNAMGESLGTVTGDLQPTSIQSWDKDGLFGPNSELSHLVLNPPTHDLNMTAAYRANGQTSSPAHVEAITTLSRHWKFFGGNWDVAFDGIAVVNMGPEATDIFINHKDFKGQSLDRQRIQSQVPPQGKALFVIGDPQVQQFTNVPDSFFEVEASQPLALTALRGSSNGQFLWVNQARTFNPPVMIETPALIEAVPTALGSQYTSNFNRYTKVVAPNGKPIHIVAQANLTDEQILRCRGILVHFLTDYPGSLYGADKSQVANKMADNGAILTLLNGQDDGQNPVQAPGQALYQNEIQVEGHDWYIHQNYDHRDAAFEEILHLVHDYGIGVDGPNSQPGALPAFQAEIRAAQQHALSNQLWGIGASSWIQELTAENSLSQEYLAALIDSYYGLWGAFQESPTHGMWGLYVAKTRDEIATEDPMGQALLNNKFFHPYLTYNARIDAGFTGTFSLKLDASLPYTHHAQYLKDVTLLGQNPIQVRVNAWDNDITGNAASNTVIFSGDRADYTVTTVDGVTTVMDQIPDRDGTNTLRFIEKLQFADITVEL